MPPRPVAHITLSDWLATGRRGRHALAAAWMRQVQAAGRASTDPAEQRRRAIANGVPGWAAKGLQRWLPEPASDPDERSR